MDPFQSPIPSKQLTGEENALPPHSQVQQLANATESKLQSPKDHETQSEKTHLSQQETIISGNENNNTNNITHDNPIIPKTSPNNRNMLYTYFPCRHDNICTFSSQTFCKLCGVRMTKKRQSQPLKTAKMDYLLHTSPLRIYKNTYQNMSRRVPVSFNQDHEIYLQQRDRAITYVIQLGEKMRISKQSVFLSIMYLDILATSDDKQHLSELKVKDHVNFYGGVCLMLAIKSVELDDKIPFLSQMKNQIQLSLYSKEDLKKAERKAVDMLKFHMHLPNLYDLLQFYGSQGIVFLDDKQKQNSGSSQPQSQVDEQANSSSTASSSSSSVLSTSPASDSNSLQQLNTPGQVKSDAEKALNEQDSLEKMRIQLQIAQSGFDDESQISFFKFFDIVSKIEKDLQRIAFFAIQDKRFYDNDLETLGIACVCFLREKNNLRTPFRQEILDISGGSLSSVLTCTSEFLSRLEVYFQQSNSYSFLSSSSSSSNNSSAIASLKDYRQPISNIQLTLPSSRSSSNFIIPTRNPQTTKIIFDNSEQSNLIPKETKANDASSSFRIQAQRIGISSQQLGKQVHTTHSGQSGLNSRNYLNPQSSSFISNCNSSRLVTNFQSMGTASSSNNMSTNKPITSFLSSDKQGKLAPSSSQAGFISLQNSLNRQFPNSAAFSTASFNKNLPQTQRKTESNSVIHEIPQFGQAAATTSTTLTSSRIDSGSFNAPSKGYSIIDDEGKWNSHLQKSINSINFKSSSSQANSFLRRKL